MHVSDLPPDLRYAVKHAANIYRMSATRWITIKLQQAVDELADANPLYREILDYKP